MMTENLRGVQVKILTYGIYALMFILTSVIAWHTTIIKAMPEQYVQLERYKEDRTDQRTSLCRIEAKLDQLIMSAVPKPVWDREE